MNLLNKKELQMNKALSIFNQLRPISVGFDNVFDHFEKMFEDEWSIPSYPPYNIFKTGNQTYNIEVALAGYNKKNIAVEYADGLLNIKSVKDEKSDNGKDDAIYKGIAKRYFSKTFTIADDVNVKKAELKDGLLKISLERILPDSKKARTIEIN
tara:strand:+ start:1263 stop:1724 length:462 start_codon:yes stop_codon:yes gene_type:complete